MNARVASTRAVSLSRFVAGRHAQPCHYCPDGKGRVLAPNGAADAGEVDTDLCPQCRGAGELVFCDACLVMTASAYQPAYELGDECRAARRIAIQVGDYTVKRLACADDDCLTRVVESARREAQGIAERQAGKQGEVRS